VIYRKKIKKKPILIKSKKHPLQQRLAENALQKFDTLQKKRGVDTPNIYDFGGQFYFRKQRAKTYPQDAEYEFKKILKKLEDVNLELNEIGENPILEVELRALFFL